MTDFVSPSEFMKLLDIQFDERSATRVGGSIAADERRHRPWGLVHGGLYTAAIEGFATTGAYEAVKHRGQQAVGVSNSSSDSPISSRGRPSAGGTWSGTQARRASTSRSWTTRRSMPG
jgi:hypothetical protein